MSPACATSAGSGSVVNNNMASLRYLYDTGTFTPYYCRLSELPLLQKSVLRELSASTK